MVCAFFLLCNTKYVITPALFFLGKGGGGGGGVLLQVDTVKEWCFERCGESVVPGECEPAPNLHTQPS